MVDEYSIHPKIYKMVEDVKREREEKLKELKDYFKFLDGFNLKSIYDAINKAYEMGYKDGENK